MSAPLLLPQLTWNMPRSGTSRDEATAQDEQDTTIQRSSLSSCGRW